MENLIELFIVLIFLFHWYIGQWTLSGIAMDVPEVHYSYFLGKSNILINIIVSKTKVIEKKESPVSRLV